jgi:hypothetical protein
MATTLSLRTRPRGVRRRSAGAEGWESFACERVGGFGIFLFLPRNDIHGCQCHKPVETAVGVINDPRHPCKKNATSDQLEDRCE